GIVRSKTRTAARFPLTCGAQGRTPIDRQWGSTRRPLIASPRKVSYPKIALLQPKWCRPAIAALPGIYAAHFARRQIPPSHNQARGQGGLRTKITAVSLGSFHALTQFVSK